MAGGPNAVAAGPPATVAVMVHVNGADLLAGQMYVHLLRGVESATFSCDQGWLSDRRGYALEPALPLVSGPQHTAPGQAMFCAFSDSAPDRWGRRLVERAERGRAEQAGSPSRRLTEAAFLFGVRDDLRQGAVRFLDAAKATYLADDATGVPTVAELPRLLDLATRVERDDATWDDLRAMMRVGSSLGGARPKVHVVAPDGNVAIAKFPSANTDTWNVMAWEKTALDLAHLAGITVPTSSLLTVAGRHVLVVDRFDRAGTCVPNAVSEEGQFLSVVDPNCIVTGLLSTVVTAVPVTPLPTQLNSADGELVLSLGQDDYALLASGGIVTENSSTGSVTSVIQLGDIPSSGSSGISAQSSSGEVPITAGLATPDGTGGLWFVPNQGGVSIGRVLSS